MQVMNEVTSHTRIPVAVIGNWEILSNFALEQNRTNPCVNDALSALSFI